MDSTNLRNSKKPRELDLSHSKAERQRKSHLILKQASDSLQEIHAARRAIDTKIHSLLGLSAGLVGLFAAFRLWVNLHPIGQLLFTGALVIYASVIVLGLLAYYPRSLHIPYPYAIVKFQDEASYEDLEKWVADDIFALAQKNANTIKMKSNILEIMVVLMILASSMLVVSGIV